MAKNDVARLLDVLAQLQPSLGMAQELGKARPPILDRLSAQIPAVQLQQVEGIHEYAPIIAAIAQPIEHGKSVPITQATASPSIKQDLMRSETTASAIRGNRAVQSWPLRVKSRTAAALRQAIIRKPSCLISCTQSGPVGGLAAGDGRQGAMKSSDGRVRARYNIGGLIPH
jgi:hypothetical protein